MSTQEQIGKLQGLLTRIQRNAAQPRASAPLPPPMAFAAPSATPTAPPPRIDAPAAFAVPAATVAAPASAFVPPTAADQSVDDLLSAAPSPSPMPVDVDVSLDSLPPPDIAAASPEPEAEAIPLVALAAEPPAASPQFDDGFSLESEVSEVRVATIARESATEEVTVAAIAAEAEPIGTEELSEDDLVEVTEGTPAPATTDVDIDFEDEDEDERPPASSQRSKVASSMDEALAAAAEQLESEHEVPLKTPPPESGPQEAPPVGLTAAAAPDVDALLGQELEIPTRAETGMGAAPAVPTPEQLGQTIDLDEARGPSLELAEAPAAEASAFVPPPVEDLEVALPPRDIVGGYDESLQPPPEALSDLEAHRRRLEEDVPPPPESLATLPSVRPDQPVAEIVPLQAAPLGPEVVARSAPAGSPETFTSVRDTFRPSSFVELLDASLALGE